MADLQIYQQFDDFVSGKLHEEALEVLNDVMAEMTSKRMIVTENEELREKQMKSIMAYIIENMIITDGIITLKKDMYKDKLVEFRGDEVLINAVAMKKNHYIEKIERYVKKEMEQE
jgi:hypothetical protein